MMYIKCDECRTLKRIHYWLPSSHRGAQNVFVRTTARGRGSVRVSVVDPCSDRTYMVLSAVPLNEATQADQRTSVRANTTARLRLDIHVDATISTYSVIAEHSSVAPTRAVQPSP